MPNKEKFTKISKKLKIAWVIITNLSVALIIVMLSVGVIYYSHGYKFNIDSGGLEKVGVMSVTSKPLLSGIFLDEEYVGRTPRTLGSIKPGTHQVRLERKDYNIWNKTVTILEDKSTPIEATLFRKNPKTSEILKIDEQVISFKADRLNRNIFITTQKANSSNNTVLYKIYRFSTDTLFWENSGETSLIYEKTLPSNKSFQLTPSNDGSYLLLTYLTNTSSALTQSYEMVDTGSNNLKTYAIPNTKNKNIKSINWTNDSQNLIIQTESSIELLAPKTFDSTLLLARTSAEQSAVGFAWTTDLDGNFYYSELVEEADTGASYYRISKVNGSDNQPETVINSIYFISDDKFIKDLELEALQSPFKNSPQSTRFAGNIKYLYVDRDARGLIIGTEFGLYYYSNDSQKFTLVAKESGEFVQTDSDSTKFLFKTAKEYGIFTFDKEEADHTSTLGSKMLYANKADSNAMLNASDDFVIVSDPSEIRAISTDGYNNYKLASHKLYSALSEDGRSGYILRRNDKGGYSLIKYSFN
ncbi:MAG: hypothetical protein Fur003_2150 [Candidatus Dojkabacteria bacterium]